MKREFVSYPKSGRSWVRYILSCLELEERLTFHHDGFEFNDGNKPPLSFDIEARLQRYAAGDKVVYLERDPRDVMVSLYFQVTGRFRDFFGYRGSISDFIRDDYFGADNLRRFRVMWEHICVERQFLRLSYEQLHDDRLTAIGGLLEYCELPYERPRLEAAVARSDFEEMRKVEQAGSFPAPWLQLRNGAPKVREGKVGGYARTLADDDIAYLNGVFGLS